jgi:hypothetical protein
MENNKIFNKKMNWKNLSENIPEVTEILKTGDLSWL